ncbi:MAG: hypothetical protein RR182_09185, partial [Alistipes sp.]
RGVYRRGGGMSECLVTGTGGGGVKIYHREDVTVSHIIMTFPPGVAWKDIKCLTIFFSQQDMMSGTWVSYATTKNEANGAYGIWRPGTKDFSNYQKQPLGIDTQMYITTNNGQLILQQVIMVVG